MEPLWCIEILKLYLRSIPIASLQVKGPKILQVWLCLSSHSDHVLANQTRCMIGSWTGRRRIWSKRDPLYLEHMRSVSKLEAKDIVESCLLLLSASEEKDPILSQKVKRTSSLFRKIRLSGSTGWCYSCQRLLAWPLWMPCLRNWTPTHRQGSCL